MLSKLSTVGKISQYCKNLIQAGDSPYPALDSLYGIDMIIIKIAPILWAIFIHFPKWSMFLQPECRTLLCWWVLERAPVVDRSPRPGVVTTLRYHPFPATVCIHHHNPCHSNEMLINFLRSYVFLTFIPSTGEKWSLDLGFMCTYTHIQIHWSNESSLYCRIYSSLSEYILI